MKIKSFKTLLREEENNTFNAFVEDIFDGKWSVAIKNFGNYTDKYHVKNVPLLYRIIFFKKEEIDQLSNTSDLNRKIRGVITAENQGHPRIYTKDDYKNIKDHLSYLASNGQKIHGYTDDSAESIYIGIILSQKTGNNDNIDFENYKGGNSEVNGRIKATNPVLSINATDFKIVASLEFDKNGWEIYEFNGIDDLQKGEDAEEPEEPEELEQNTEVEPQQDIK